MGRLAVQFDRRASQFLNSSIPQSITCSPICLSTVPVCRSRGPRSVGAQRQRCGAAGQVAIARSLSRRLNRRAEWRGHVDEYSPQRGPRSTTVARRHPPSLVFRAQRRIAVALARTALHSRLLSRSGRRRRSATVTSQPFARPSLASSSRFVVALPFLVVVPPVSLDPSLVARVSLQQPAASSLSSRFAKADYQITRLPDSSTSMWRIGN